jgi:putative hydrolase of the HAD superfamily
MVQAVFFDMDDTLLDGYAAMTAAWGVVCSDEAERQGCEAEALREAIRRESMLFWKDEAVVGHWRVRLDEAREQCVRLALEKEGLDHSRAGQIARRYAEEHRARLQLFDDAIETLETLRERGLRTALLTNGAGIPQRNKIERFNLAQYMDAVVVEGEFGKGKPEREVFEHALAVVGVDAREAWHVGDNLFADIGGAKSAGLHAVWIHRGRLEIREDAPAVPDRSISHLHELRAALGL